MYAAPYAATTRGASTASDGCTGLLSIVTSLKPTALSCSHMRLRASGAMEASDLPAELLTANARAVVVPDASMAPDARTLMCDQLRAVGFSDVTMLSKAVQPSEATEAAPRVVAA